MRAAKLLGLWADGKITLPEGDQAATGIVAVTGSASARVVCNGDGDCWDNQSVDVFAPPLGLTVHEDNNWKWAEGETHHWREHEGKATGRATTGAMSKLIAA
jgi:hypothetical protein